MEESSEKNKIKADRLFYVGIGLALLFAATWGLPSFFNWIFFTATLYVFFLSWYVKPRAPRENPFRARPFQRPTDQGAYEAPIDRAAAGRRAIVIVAMVVFFIFFLLFFIGIFVEDDQSGSTAYDVVSDEYQDALRENPNDLDALTNVGNQFFENQQYDSAHFYYDRVLKMDGANQSALYNKGLIYYNQQQYDRSIEILKRCASAHPDYGDAYLILGHDYYDQQKQDEALLWYAKAYDSGIKNAFLSHVLAYLYDNKGNIAKAIPLYKEAIQLDSSRSDIYPRLAELEPGNAAKYNALAAKWKSN